MALIFQVDDEGHVRPKIRCDSCGGVIENYADGVAVLDTPTPKPGAVIEPIFRCIGCEEKAEKTSVPQHSMPIDHFMLYVLNNIQLTPNALEEAGRSLKDLRQAGKKLELIDFPMVPVGQVGDYHDKADR